MGFTCLGSLCLVSGLNWTWDCHVSSRPRLYRVNVFLETCSGTNRLDSGVLLIYI